MAFDCQQFGSQQRLRIYNDIVALDSAGSTTEGGRTTDDMMQKSTYVGWDFANIWSIDEGQGLQRLAMLVALSAGSCAPVVVAEQESCTCPLTKLHFFAGGAII